MADVSFTIELTGISPTERLFYIPNWIVGRTAHWPGKVAGAGWEPPYIWEFGSIRGAGYNDVPDTGYIEVKEFEGYVNGEWSGKPTGNKWYGDVRTISDGEYIIFDVLTATKPPIEEKKPVWPWVAGGLTLLTILAIAASRAKK